MRSLGIVLYTASDDLTRAAAAELCVNIPEKIVKIDEHVIISLHHILGLEQQQLSSTPDSSDQYLETILSCPLDPSQCLQGEILICIKKVFSDNIMMTTVLITDLFLNSFIILCCSTQEKYQLGSMFLLQKYYLYLVFQCARCAPPNLIWSLDHVSVSQRYFGYDSCFRSHQVVW